MKVRAYGKTDIGRVRERNEDNILIAQKERLFVVCDGMGGHASGELASLYACEVVKDICIKKNIIIDNIIYQDLNMLPNETQKILTAIRLANQRIYLESTRIAERKGMGTTIALIYLDENGYVSLINVGDSRIYRLRDDSFEQLTNDHTWMNELLEDKEIDEKDIINFRQKNVLTRALGVEPVVKIDVRLESIKNGDIFLICSDGLSGLLSNEEIKSTIENNRENLNVAVDSLIASANAKGGTDNISVILVEVNELKKELYTVPIVHTITENENMTPLLQKIVRKYYKTAAKKTPKHIPILMLVAIILILSAVFIFRPQKTTKFVPSVARIEIKTSPDSVLVEVNGRKLGTTPFVIDSLTPGQIYYITLTKKGYLPKSESIIVSDTLKIRYYSLIPEATVMVYYWESGDAEFFIDGQKYGKLRKLENKPIPVSSGMHHFCIMLSEKEIFSKRIMINKRNMVEINPDESETKQIRIKSGGENEFY